MQSAELPEQLTVSYWNNRNTLFIVKKQIINTNDYARNY